MIAFQLLCTELNFIRIPWTDQGMRIFPISFNTINVEREILLQLTRKEREISPAASWESEGMLQGKNFERRQNHWNAQVPTGPVDRPSRQTNFINDKMRKTKDIGLCWIHNWMINTIIIFISVKFLFIFEIIRDKIHLEWGVSRVSAVHSSNNSWTPTPIANST